MESRSKPFLWVLLFFDISYANNDYGFNRICRMFNVISIVAIINLNGNRFFSFFFSSFFLIVKYRKRTSTMHRENWSYHNLKSFFFRYCCFSYIFFWSIDCELYFEWHQYTHIWKFFEICVKLWRYHKIKCIALSIWNLILLTPFVLAFSFFYLLHSCV